MADNPELFRSLGPRIQLRRAERLAAAAAAAAEAEAPQELHIPDVEVPEAERSADIAGCASVTLVSSS